MIKTMILNDSKTFNVLGPKIDQKRTTNIDPKSDQKVTPKRTPKVTPKMDPKSDQKGPQKGPF